MEKKCNLCAGRAKSEISKVGRRWQVFKTCGCGKSPLFAHTFSNRRKAEMSYISLRKPKSKTILIPALDRAVPDITWDNIDKISFCRSCGGCFAKETVNQISMQCKDCEVSRLNGLVRQRAIDNTPITRAEREYEDYIKNSWGH